MAILLDIGLAFSLGGPLLLLLASKWLRFNSLSLPSRLFLWLLAFIVLALAAFSGSPWLRRVGAQPVGWIQLIGAVVATITILGAFPFLQRLQKAVGGTSEEQTETFQKIACLPVPYRVFLVVTAATVEEVLYRGYAIGIGQYVLDSLPAAFIISLLVFVATHFRWGISHLISVFWAALVLSLLFVFTNNLFACILAHFTVDAVGFLLLPSVMPHQRIREAPTIHEG